MSYEDWRQGYYAGYTLGYGDGVRRLPPDDRTPAERFTEQAELVVEENGQLAFDFGEEAND